MAEMKTLNGHEIVDAKARARLDTLEKEGVGGGESENLRILVTKVDGGTGVSSHTAQAIYEADVAERVIEAIMDGYRYEYLGATHFAANGVCDEVTFYRTLVEANGGAYTETVKIFDDGTATVETVETAKIDAYTKDEVNQMVSAIPKFKVEVVTVHPTITEASTTTIYLVPSGDDDQNLYTEWICVEKDGVRTWEKLGTQHLDLTGYVTTEELDAAVEAALAEAKASGAFKGDKGDKGDTGATGPQGPKGDPYTLTEDDKALIVAQVIASLGGNPVFGYVDDENNIIVQGNLADGTYSVKYEIENENGTVTTVDIGDLVLDSNIYYSVTKNLTHCTLSNSATQVAKGTAYTATVTADSGYELDSVSVTMGGSAVSVSGGNINIASVTGDIVITAVAEQTATTEPANFFAIGEDGYIINGRCSSTGDRRTDSSGDVVSNYIQVQNGDTIYVKNVPLETKTYSGMKLTDGSTIGIVVNDSEYITNYSASDGVTQLTISKADAAYIRLTLFIKNGIAITEDDVISANIIINIKRNGEWLTDTTIYTNLADPNDTYWKDDQRLSISNGNTSACTGKVVTNFIPATAGSVLRVKGIDLLAKLNDQHGKIVFYSEKDAESSKIDGLYIATTSGEQNCGSKVTVNGDISTYTVAYNNDGTQVATAACKYIRLEGVLLDGYTKNDVMITVDKEIV